jgi:hypothetical protein
MAAVSFLERRSTTPNANIVNIKPGEREIATILAEKFPLSTERTFLFARESVMKAIKFSLIAFTMVMVCAFCAVHPAPRLSCTQCGGGSSGPCQGGSSSGPGLEAPPGQTGCSSPIIVDVSGNGFFLTSAAFGVLFDISGTGTPIQMGWTAQGADNAFLALPDADGLVDNGKQLFGNFTPQAPSNNPNGFAALAVYDLPINGGNGDGIIDSRDAIYSSLRLWIDANHDGISQPGELHTLPSLGVTSISLNYILSRRVDQYGNVFRYEAAVDLNDPDPTHVGRTAYDVFFVTQ